jgi:hypothetical protein
MTASSPKRTYRPSRGLAIADEHLRSFDRYVNDDSEFSLLAYNGHLKENAVSA